MKHFALFVFLGFSTYIYSQSVEPRFASPSQYEWTKCFLITSAGDTLHGYVKNRDFSLYTNDVTRPMHVQFKYYNAAQKEFKYEDLNEIYVMAPDGNQLYVSMGDGHKIIYRVVIDGPCRLLAHFSEVIFKPDMPGQPPQEREIIERYTVCYKGILSKSLSSYQSIYVPGSFRKNCYQFFGDCPDLAEKVKSRKFKSEKIADMVTEFNKCVSPR